MLFFFFLSPLKKMCLGLAASQAHRSEGSEVAGGQSGLHTSWLMLLNLRPLVFWAFVSPE